MTKTLMIVRTAAHLTTGDEAYFTYQVRRRDLEEPRWGDSKQRGDEQVLVGAWARLLEPPRNTGGSVQFQVQVQTDGDEVGPLRLIEMLPSAPVVVLAENVDVAVFSDARTTILGQHETIERLREYIEGLHAGIRAAAPVLEELIGLPRKDYG